MAIRTLIVEDDPMVSSINADYLKRLNEFELVGTAKNGEEAHRLLHQHEVDLLLLDIYMPALNGLQLLRKIRSEFVKVDVILITAADAPQVIEETLRLGVVDCILKPFDFDRFKDALMAYKRRHTLFRTTRTIKQENLDRLMRPAQPAHEEELPKGIDPVTLGRIRQTLQEAGEPLSVQDLSERLDISTLTIRKYLQYLTETEEVELDLHYSKKGRPVKLYALRQ